LFKGVLINVYEELKRERETIERFTHTIVLEQNEYVGCHEGVSRVY